MHAANRAGIVGSVCRKVKLGSGRQGPAEVAQGLELRLEPAGQLQPPDVRGDETSHQATYSAGRPARRRSAARTGL
jgi:hypothetical protein